MHKVRELGDLMLELYCAKTDPHLTRLSYLDTARGVCPIMEKLPTRLQEVWISKGSRYKQDHGVAFPPFGFFSKFVRKQAKTRNDPSFMLRSASSTVPKYPKNDKWAMNEGNRKAPIYVHLTYVDLCSETPPSTARKKVELDQILSFAQEAASLAEVSSIYGEVT